MPVFSWAARRPVVVMSALFLVLLALATLLVSASPSSSLLAESPGPAADAYGQMAALGLLSLTATLVGAAILRITKRGEAQLRANARWRGLRALFFCVAGFAVLTILLAWVELEDASASVASLQEPLLIASSATGGLGLIGLAIWVARTLTPERPGNG